MTTWWFWIALGAVLLAAEAIIATDFYLVFFGLAAVVVGGLALAGVHLPAWGQWLLFAVLSIAGVAVFRRRWKQRLARGSHDLTPDLEGERGQTRDPLAPGARGRIVLRGSDWDAVNDGPDALAAGTACIVTKVEGLTLRVRGES